MDKCRAFDVWLDKRLCEMEAIGLDEAFYAGRQSRQAEVDEYKMVSESIEDLYLLERKKVKAVEQVLIDLKESMTNFKEMDLYDKGVRNTTVYAIKDLEKALRGAHE